MKNLESHGRSGRRKIGRNGVFVLNLKTKASSLRHQAINKPEMKRVQSLSDQCFPAVEGLKAWLWVYIYAHWNLTD